MDLYNQEIQEEKKDLQNQPQTIQKMAIGTYISTITLNVGEGKGSPLQYSCLENPVDRGAWWAAVHGVAQSWTQLKRLSMPPCIGEENGNPLQYVCLENPGDRGVWWATVYGVAQSWTGLK